MTEVGGAGAAPPAAGVGAVLRQAREAQGLGIDDVAQQLKFAPRQIESLEQERFDRLPGPTIARGMVRNYARLLRLDAEPLLRRMSPQSEAAADPAQIAERFRREVPFSDSGKRQTLIYAAFSVALLVLVGLLAYGWQQQQAAPQLVAPAGEEPTAEPAQPVAAAQPAPSAPDENTLEGKNVEEHKAEDTKKVEDQKKAEAPPASASHRLVLRTEAEAWLEVKDASGRTLVAWLAPAGTERSVRGQPPFEIVIGNASAVRLTYDGKPVDLRPHTRVEVARFILK